MYLGHLHIYRYPDKILIFNTRITIKCETVKSITLLDVCSVHFVHSLLFNLVSSSASHVPRVILGFAAMPQVYAGFGDIEQNHGGARA